MKKQLKSDLALLGITVVWGASFTLMKEGIKDVPPYTFLALRYLIGCIVLFLFFYRRIIKMNFETIKYGIMIGIALAVGGIFQIIGLKYTTASNSGFITGLSVVFVPILIALLYKKLPEVRAIIGIVLSILGLGFLTLSQGVSINQGDLLTLVSSLFLALQIILIDKYSPGFDSICLTVVEMGTVAVISLILGFFLEGMRVNITPSATFGILFTGIICSALAYWVQMEAQKHTSPTHAALIFLGEPVFTAIIASIFLKEVMTFKMLLGSLFILAGMIISEFGPKAED